MVNKYKKGLMIFLLVVAFLGSCYLETQMQDIDDITRANYNQHFNETN